MSPLRLAIGAVAIKVVFAVALPVAAAPAVVELLVVEANEGNSSGGHLALRFAAEVYHYEHAAPGIARLRRDTWQHFRRVYSDLGNRAITAQSVDLDDATAARARDHFASQRWMQDASLAALSEIERDIALLEELGDIAAGVAMARRLAGVGLFAGPGDGAVFSGVDSGLAALRARIESVHGATALAAEAERTRRAIAALRVGVAAPRMAGRGLATDYDELAGRLVALRLLGGAARLNPAVVLTEKRALTPPERRWLHGAKAELESRVVDLFASSRVDRATALLVGMARLLAFEQSLASNHLHLLEVFDEDAPRVELDRRPWVVDSLLARSRTDYAHHRRRLFTAAADSAAGFAESHLSRLESAASRRRELERSRAQARSGEPSVRVRRGTGIPSRRGEWRGLPAPPVSRRHLPRLREMRDVLAEEIGERWRYDLVARNCATELLGQLFAAVPELASGGDPLAFVPALAPRSLRDTDPRTGRRRIAPLRERRIAARARRDGALLVALRESTTWTSELYRRWSATGDSEFLFFTQERPLLRPLLGAANLSYALASGTIGVARAPVDSGALLLSSMRGAIFALPELVFVNIRKGSYVHIPAGTGLLGNDWPPPTAEITSR